MSCQYKKSLNLTSQLRSAIIIKVANFSNGGGGHVSFSKVAQKLEYIMLTSLRAGTTTNLDCAA